MNKKANEQLVSEFIDNFRDSYIEQFAGALDWKDVEMDTPDHKKFSANEIKGEFKKIIRESLDDTKANERSSAGFNLIIKHLGEYPNDRLCLKELENAAKSLRTSLDDAIGPNADKMQQTLSENIDFVTTLETMSEDSNADEEFATPPSLAEQWQVSPETLMTFYQIGVKLYEELKLEEAICVFTYLSLLDQYNHDVWVSLGMCQQRANEWMNAIQSYTTASLMNPLNPIPYFYSIDCYIGINNYTNAHTSLQMAEHFITEENKEQMTPLLAHYKQVILQHHE
jgi:tetratricopeptide (TPR) repeat protein